MPEGLARRGVIPYLQFKSHGCTCTGLYVTLTLGRTCRRRGVVLFALILGIGLLLVEFLEANHRVHNLILLAGDVLVHACDVGIHGDGEAEQFVLFLAVLGIGFQFLGSLCQFLLFGQLRSGCVLIEDCYP